MTEAREKTIVQKAGWVVLAALLSMGAVQGVDILRAADQHRNNHEVHLTTHELQSAFIPREVVEVHLAHIREQLDRIEVYVADNR